MATGAASDSNIMGKRQQEPAKPGDPSWGHLRLPITHHEARRTKWEWEKEGIGKEKMRKTSTLSGYVVVEESTYLKQRGRRISDAHVWHLRHRRGREACRVPGRRILARLGWLAGRVHGRGNLTGQAPGWPRGGPAQTAQQLRPRRPRPASSLGCTLPAPNRLTPAFRV